MKSTWYVLKLRYPLRLYNFFISGGMKWDLFYYMEDVNMNIIFDCIFNIWYVVFELELTRKTTKNLTICPFGISSGYQL